MAAAHVRAVRRPRRGRDPEARDEPVDEGQVALVRPRAHVLRLDVPERLEELLLLGLREHLVGHREEHLVLLRDVSAQELDVVPGAQRELRGLLAAAALVRGDRFGHPADVRAPLLVLGEHHGDGADVLRQPLAAEHREERVLLLPVVAAVGEGPEEIEDLLRGTDVERGAPSGVLRQLLEAVEDLRDRFVFRDQDLRGARGVVRRGLHRSLRSKYRSSRFDDP